MSKSIGMVDFGGGTSTNIFIFSTVGLGLRVKQVDSCVAPTVRVSCVHNCHTCDLLFIGQIRFKKAPQNFVLITQVGIFLNLLSCTLASSLSCFYVPPLSCSSAFCC